MLALVSQKKAGLENFNIKVDLRARNITRDKESYFIMRTRSMKQEI